MFLFNDTYRDQFDGLPNCIQTQLVARLVKKGTPQDQIKALVNDEVFEMLDRQLKLYTKRKEKARAYAAKKRGAALAEEVKPDNAVPVMGAAAAEPAAFEKAWQNGGYGGEPPRKQGPAIVEPTPIESEESEDDEDEDETDSNSDDEPNVGEIIVPPGVDMYEPKKQQKNNDVVIPTTNTFRDGLMSFIM